MAIMEDQLNSRLEAIEEIVGQVRECLVGNEFSKNKGLVDDVLDLKRKVAAQDLFIKNLKFVIGLTAGAGGIIGFFIQLLTQFFLTKK